MRSRGLYLLCLLVLPFWALSAHADSIDAADAVASQAEGDLPIGSTLLTASSASVFFTNGDPFDQLLVRVSAVPTPTCRVLAQNGTATPGSGRVKSTPGCNNGTGGIFFPWGHGGGIAHIPEPVTQTTGVPEPATLLLFATGLIGGAAARMRQLIARM